MSRFEKMLLIAGIALTIFLFINAISAIMVMRINRVFDWEGVFAIICWLIALVGVYCYGRIVCYIQENNTKTNSR